MRMDIRVEVLSKPWGKKGSFQTPVQTEVSMCKPYSPLLGKVAAGEEHKLVCACES